MDTATLEIELIDDGKKYLDHLRRVGVDVRVAFWALTTEEETWYLYIASRLVDDDGLAAAYRKIYPELARSQVEWVARSDIKLISSQSPIADEAVAFQDARLATKFGGRKLGNLIVEDAYIYPK